MDRLNVAVIGCGAIYPNHADAIVEYPGVKLYAVCDKNEERAKKAAHKYECKHYIDYEDMLKDKEINIVHICTPHYLHAPMAIKAMQSGKHVLTEKPIATSTSDALEMIRVSKETGRHFGVCFQNRYNSTSLRVKEILESGKAGRVIGAKAFVTWFRDEKYYTESGWRGTWEREGGGVLINQAIHTLDLLQWFIGDIERIKANVDTRVLEGVIEVEDTADATICFKNQAKALFYATNGYVRNSPVEIEIVCENAVIKLCDDLIIKYKDGQVEQLKPTDKKTGEKAYWGASHGYLIHDFYNKILSGEKFGVGGEEGITALKMIECIYKSSKTGEYINF